MEISRELKFSSTKEIKRALATAIPADPPSPAIRADNSFSGG
jgi:hypothetical protein